MEISKLFKSNLNKNWLYNHILTNNPLSYSNIFIQLEKGKVAVTKIVCNVELKSGFML